jgi:hypothetical protein
VASLASLRRITAMFGVKKAEKVRTNPEQNPVSLGAVGT